MSTITVKGQVTVPKPIRDALGLTPGARVDFDLDEQGRVVLRRADAPEKRARDRFEAARGKADIPWRTDALMALLRGD
ncbi:MAG: type II toxin-antitoxin system PrlF family antitoxin [Ottowia sp.]|uniref:AbrB/MazE/SpoVT family DNA-binding domain-containing protein n=1 Tax=Ottowia sp. TaxID=1898956 RepID=UPI0039E58F06